MYRNIYGSLDRQRLQRAANDSRTEHLFDLMNWQTANEQRDYDDSTKAYLKANLNSKIENYIRDYVNSMDADIKDFIKEYNIDNDIMEYIYNYFPDDEWLEYKEDSFKYWLYSKKQPPYSVSIRISIDSEYGGCFSLGVYNNDPSKYDLVCVEKIASKQILGYLYYDYIAANKHSNNKDDFYNFVLDALDSIFQSISEIFSKAIESYVKKYPPKLN